MSDNYGQSQNQGCKNIPLGYLTPAVNLRFIAGYDQSQSTDDYGSNQGVRRQASGGYGNQGGDTQDQCIYIPCVYALGC